MAQGFLFAKPMTLADALAFASSGVVRTEGLRRL